ASGALAGVSAGADRHSCALRDEERCLSGTIAATVYRAFLDARAGWRAWRVDSSARRSAEGGRDLVDRRLLGRADVHAVLAMRGGDLLGNREHEAPVVVDLVRRRLGREQRDRFTHPREHVLLELVDRPVVRVV